MPEMRARVSATLLSGNLPMSSATMESMTWSERILICCEFCAERRTPLTVTTDTSAAGSALASAATASCAQTEAVLSKPIPASAATAAFKVNGRGEVAASGPVALRIMNLQILY